MTDNSYFFIHIIVSDVMVQLMSVVIVAVLSGVPRGGPAWWSSVVVQRGDTLCQLINGIVGLGLVFVAYISCNRQSIFLHSHYCFRCKGQIDASGRSGSPF